MLRYICKKLIYGFLTLWIIASITFFLMHMLPGDPFVSEKKIPPKVKEKLLEKYHLDKPLMVQYRYYMSSLAKGDLGLSMKVRGRSVNKMIKTHFPKSLILGLLATIIAFVVGVSIGIVAGLYRGKKLDSASMLLAIVGVSVPSFILGGILQWFVLFLKKLTGDSILPIAGYGEFKHLIMPSIALALMPLAIIARMMRASMIEVLSQDYIRTAKAKGLSPFKIIVKHCMRNAILPVVTYLGPLLAAITTGSFVIEKVFAIPGLGRYFVQSISDRDYTLTLGIVVFYAFLLIVMMLLVDLMYGLIDPRIRVVKGKGEK